MQASVLCFLSSLCLCASVVQIAGATPPSLTSLYPAGGQRGAATEVAAIGAIDKATKLWANGKGIHVEPGKEIGKFSVKVAADAVPGTYWLRAYNGDGASTLRP